MNAVKLIASVGLPLLLGAIAGMFTAKAVPEWYATLNQPVFNPPNWIFGPVWTALYILMGISLFLVWRLPSGPERNTALIVFFVQLLLNFAWSFIFFYYKMIGLAFIEILILWITIVVMLILFYRVKPAAMWLNVPYLLWVSFASVLNGTYYFLN
jgi:tryptophan-rich sensory protein